MSMRVHELAKEIDISSAELLDIIHEMGLEATNHMSALDESQVAAIRDEVGAPDPNAAPVEAPPEEPAAAEEAEDAAPAADPAEEESAEAVTEEAEEDEAAKVITIKNTIIVKELAERMEVKPNILIAELMKMNIFASINEKLEVDMANQIAEKHGFSVEKEKKRQEAKPEQPPAPKPEEEEEADKQEDRPESLHARPPVVTFLGHVDHGKTSLLDYLRKSNVVSGEDGGITQHIGAYTVDVNDDKITFIDTPGHAAFTAMRARGANLTDVAIIVVAADQGIQPQTREAIAHAKAAKVSIIVAINKIDLPTADVDRIKLQLQQEDLTPEDWGGEVICCPVSAQTGDGIAEMLEMILLQSEMMELQANPDRPATGFVVEARLEQGMGPTADILVKAGTLRVGDAVVCGPYWGKVKAMYNARGAKVRTAGPSEAVKCLGLTSVPEAGTEFKVYSNDRKARKESETRLAANRLEDLGSPSKKVSLDELLSQTDAAQMTKLPILLKADVQGSLEAIQHSLDEIESDKIEIQVILTGVGAVSVNDVMLASASNAVIFGFHVGVDTGVNPAAKKEGVEIRLYSVIYELLDDIRTVMTGMLEPVYKEKVIGHTEIRQVFEIGKRSRVAGCMVIDGRVRSKSKARLKRDGDVVYEGTLRSLKRFQNDASEVREGQECGIALDNYNDYKEGDIMEFYELESIKQEL